MRFKVFGSLKRDMEQQRLTVECPTNQNYAYIEILSLEHLLSLGDIRIIHDDVYEGVPFLGYYDPYSGDC